MERAQSCGIAGLGSIGLQAALDEVRRVLRLRQSAFERGGVLARAARMPRSELEQPASCRALLRAGGRNDAVDQARIKLRPDRQPVLEIAGREAAVARREFQGDVAGLERFAVGPRQDRQQYPAAARWRGPVDVEGS